MSAVADGSRRAGEWSTWGRARPRSAVLHLDTAAVGRSSTATLTAVAQHAQLEAEVGGYVAEERATATLDAVRRDVATLLGTDPEGLAFVESATAALAALVGAWPMPPGGRVGVPAASWGPNLEILEHHGLRTEGLAVDDDGVLDLDQLERRLRVDPPHALLIDQIVAHRGLIQPAQSVVALGRAHGVPVWVDAAQALGQVPVAAGDAVFATSRKWLTGPRGVGMLAVAPAYRDTLLVRPHAKLPDLPPVLHLQSGEAHVAGRVGLGVAVREHFDLGPERVAERLAEVGRLTREAVSSVRGWGVARPGAPAGAITSIVPTAGQSVVRTSARLLGEHAILTTACLPWRAPRELSWSRGQAMVRLSPHVDLTDADLERLCRALTTW
jgi:pyridoxal 5-phosphate dependent beta-lyase